MDRYIKTIYNKANEMDLLINELTLYSKIDTNRIPYNFTTISAKGYFGDCGEDLHMELESKGIEFTYCNTMEEDCKVIVDPEQLRRVINNIVSNSLKYMDKPNGKVTMEVKDVGDFIQVELGDNGKGIAAKRPAVHFRSLLQDGCFPQFIERRKRNRFVDREEDRGRTWRKYMGDQ